MQIKVIPDTMYLSIYKSKVSHGALPVRLCGDPEVVLLNGQRF